MHLVGDGQDKFCRMERQSPFLREACYTRAALQERLLAALRPQIVDLEAMPVLVGQSAGYEAASPGRLRPGGRRLARDLPPLRQRQPCQGAVNGDPGGSRQLGGHYCGGPAAKLGISALTLPGG
jgi:hypothetical protein